MGLSGTPEFVAFALMEKILNAEQPQQLTRQYLFDLYRECFQTVTGGGRSESKSRRES
jgi:hypothetical protein